MIYYGFRNQILYLKIGEKMDNRLTIDWWSVVFSAAVGILFAAISFAVSPPVLAGIVATVVFCLVFSWAAWSTGAFSRTGPVSF